MTQCIAYIRADETVGYEWLLITDTFIFGVLMTIYIHSIEFPEHEYDKNSHLKGIVKKFKPPVPSCYEGRTLNDIEQS